MVKPALVAVRILAVVAVISMMAAAARRAELWADPLRLWKDAAEKSPLKPRPRLNYARALAESGDWESAAAEYRKAMEVANGRPAWERMMARQIAIVNLSQMLLRNGSPEALDEAERLLTIAWNEEPGFPGTAINMSAVWMEQGKDQMALDILNMGQSRIPDYPWFTEEKRLYLTRAFARAKLGDCAGANEDLKRSGQKQVEIEACAQHF